MDKSDGHGKPRGARANREGKPWKRTDGRWTARVYPPAGTIETKPERVYGKTRAEVVQKRKDREAELARGLGGDPDMLLGDYFHRWLSATLPEYVRAGDMAESTMDSYRDNAELHIVPAARGVPTLRHIKIGDLTAAMVREWQDKLGRKPSGRGRRKLRPGEAELPAPPVLSVRTVAYCRTILHKAIADAIRDEVGGISRNVVDLVQPPKDRRRKERRTITVEEAGAALQAMTESPLWCYWLLVLLLGFRRGEGLGMAWSDIDREARTWKPGRSVQRLRGEKDPETGCRKGKLVAKELKTDASQLTVALPLAACEALELWEAEQQLVQITASAWADLGLVFTTSVGTAIEPRNVNREWEKVRTRAGLPDWVTIHEWRHMFGSLLLEAGVSLKTVQRALRHSRQSTTAVYLHALEEVPRGAADAMDEIYAGIRAASRRSGS